ncbi:MAG: hypothetical protein EAX86_11590 [Candidatus Heimdallarchaeota archaeon]|nr:hypothetical protein [Candidatus Heimdallarchaeota archaeon]
MKDWDLVIYDSEKAGQVINRFCITEKTLAAAGQHGKAIILTDEHGKDWLLKTFSNIIDFEMEKILDLEVDIKASPEDSQSRMHLWRVFNELTAARLGEKLKLNVPEVILICSQKISDIVLKPSTRLSLGNVVILDEDGGPETADEYYELCSRESFILKTSKRFESQLAQRSKDNDPSTVLGLLTEKISNSMNLDEYLDSFNGDLDSAFISIREINDGFTLLPFDIWLNDPDRNAGNYLVQTDDKNKTKHIWGIDYEMWSLGSDIWMDEDDITQGRSYLTAIIHPSTNIFDQRVLETLHRIRLLTDEEIHKLTRMPQLACKFFEYHIDFQNLDPEERIVLKQVETNLEDFLLESKPRTDKLSDILIKQIGLPSDFDDN